MLKEVCECGLDLLVEGYSELPTACTRIASNLHQTPAQIFTSLLCRWLRPSSSSKCRRFRYVVLRIFGAVISPQYITFRVRLPQVNTNLHPLLVVLVADMIIVAVDKVVEDTMNAIGEAHVAMGEVMVVVVVVAVAHMEAVALAVAGKGVVATLGVAEVVAGIIVK